MRGEVNLGLRHKKIGGDFGGNFPFYVLAILLNSLRLMSLKLILYKANTILKPMNTLWAVPLIYMLIQGVDAPAALFSGIIYDKLKMKVFVVPLILSIIPTLLVMGETDLIRLIAAALIFGLVLGA
ncbi:MAG: hypothetical protein QXX99_01785 [Candidatus Bathyarchaeia archaeon]